eukprot:scaffold20609_cov85-Isochrysis_galbana.AAC.1
MAVRQPFAPATASGRAATAWSRAASRFCFSLFEVLFFSLRAGLVDACRSHMDKIDELDWQE